MYRAILLSHRPLNALAGVTVLLISVGLFSAVLGYFAFIPVWQNVNDFHALWAYGVVARLHGGAFLYDFPALHAEQTRLGLREEFVLPFGYPPTFIGMVWPFGLLSLYWSFWVWMAFTGACYLVAVGWNSPARWSTVLLSAIIPTSSLNLYCGQSGFLAAALLLGGMRLSKGKPLLAGVLLGLLTYKPQLGLLVPVALAAARLWPCMVAALMTTFVLLAGTGFVFGWGIWSVFVHSISAYQSVYARIPLAQIPTPLANLRLLGFSDGTAWALQAMLAVAAGAVVWRVWRRNGPLEQALLVLSCSTFLATPHAMLYDLTIVGGAIVLHVDNRLRGDVPLSSREILVLSVGLMLPFALNSHMSVPISSVALVLVLWVAVSSRTGAHPMPRTVS